MYGWKEVTADDARKRNLMISIVKESILNKINFDILLSEEDLKTKFYFCKRDVVLFTDIFFVKSEDGYALNDKMKEQIKKIEEMQKIAKKQYADAKVVFFKKFGCFYEECENEENWMRFDAEKLNEIYDELKSVIPILHWGALPIIDKWLMINGGRLPEDDLIDFYNHYHTLTALYKELKGEGKCMSTIGDDTLDKEMTFSVYSRRWGHKDNYRIKRTVNGWYVSHIAINGECDKDGSNILFANLKQDYIFYPEDAIKHAMEKLWEEADEGELDLEELQERLQQVADWITALEKTVGEQQPDWVQYY